MPDDGGGPPAVALQYLMVGETGVVAHRDLARHGVVLEAALDAG